jgi:hypothetical protein
MKLIHKNMIKFAKYYSLEIIIVSIWTLLWLGLGTHLTETFNIHNYYLGNINFFRANLLFYICIVLLIFLFFHKKTKYLLLVLYPISGFIGFILNSNESVYFGIHYSISLIVLSLFLNLICSEKVNKKLIFFSLHYSSITILVLYSLFIIGPDLINKIYNFTTSARGEVEIYIKLNEMITIYIPQNSNGASRIIFILTMLLTCVYNFFLEKKSTLFNILLIIIIIMLATTNIFFQSKLNIFAFILSTTLILLNTNFNKKKLKLFSLIIIITMPFLINNMFQKNFMSDNRILSFEEGIFAFKKGNLYNKNFDKNINLKDLNINVYNINDLEKLCFTFNSSLDKFSSGRLCGWELLTNIYIQNFKFWGYGYFEDRKVVKNFQKLSSNTYLFGLFNAGILSFFVLLIFYIVNYFKTVQSYKLMKKENNYKILPMFYTLLTAYLIIRSLLEDTLAFISIDFLLIINCISFFNYFLTNQKKNTKNIA